MISRIQKALPKHTITSSVSSTLFIVDYKNINGGGVKLHDTKPHDKAVYLENSIPIEIFFDGFEENCLPTDDPGVCNSQCECVMFPKSEDDNHWILFIEMKYANDRTAAFRKDRNYPENMITQILETVNYFRRNEIISKDKRVNAIVSFPKLIEEFSSTFFTGKMSVDDILYDHNILIRATNTGFIKSKKRLYL